MITNQTRGTWRNSSVQMMEERVTDSRPSSDSRPTTQGVLMKRIFDFLNGHVGQVFMALAMSVASLTAYAQETVRIALPTKTYWSTVVATAAQEKGLFLKEGIQADLTIYRSGADVYQALAANAADIGIATAALTGSGMKRGVQAKIVGIGTKAPLGWHLVVLKDSKVKSVRDLAGKKIGINGAGSLSDMLAKWATKGASVNATMIPLGGGGVVPNLRSGNVDAIVLYAPLSYQMLDSGEIRSLVDYAKDMPPSAIDTWTASPQFLAKPATVSKVLRALYAGVELLKSDKDYAIKLIAKNSEVPEAIARLEYENTYRNLPSANEKDLQLVDQYLQYSKMIGMVDLPSAEQLIFQGK